MLTLWFVDMMGGKGTKGSDALRGWSEQRLEQLDGWLENRRFVATDEFTVADILMAHVLVAAADQKLLGPYPNIVSFQKRCTERPAWKKTVDAYCARVEPA